MERPDFDFDQVFDDDYLFFYAAYLDDERSDADTDLVVRVLEVPAGAALLDLACGHGRISNRLAAKGYRVTGLDSTELFLEAARKDAGERAVDVEYVQGDMRNIPWSGRFDGVVNWFTAFGYFSDEENSGVLREVARSLKPGGVFVMETLNRDWLIKNFQRASVEERDGAFLIDKRTWDYETGFIATERIIVKEGKTRRFTFSVRTFTVPEISGWLREAGFTNVEAFAGAGEPYSPEIARLVIRASK